METRLGLNETFTPEYLAMREVLSRTEKMQEISVVLLRQPKITQDFLRDALEALVDCYFNLEEKTIECMKQNRSYSREIDELRNEVNQQRYKLINLSAEHPSIPA